MVVVAEEQLATLPARIAVARAYLSQARGDVAATARHAALALARAADAEPLLRARAEALMGRAHWASGELEEAQRAMAAWTAHTRQAGKLAFALASAFYLAQIRIAQGSRARRPGSTGSICSLCRRTTRRAGWPRPSRRATSGCLRTR